MGVSERSGGKLPAIHKTWKLIKKAISVWRRCGCMADAVSFDILVAATCGRQANVERKSSIQMTLGRRRSRRMRRQGPNTKSFYGKATPRACVKSMQEREDLARCVAQSFVVPLPPLGHFPFPRYASHSISLSSPSPPSFPSTGLLFIPAPGQHSTCTISALLSFHVPHLPYPALRSAAHLLPTLCHPLFANRPLPPTL